MTFFVRCDCVTGIAGESTTMLADQIRECQYNYKFFILLRFKEWRRRTGDDIDLGRVGANLLD